MLEALRDSTESGVGRVKKAMAAEAEVFEPGDPGLLPFGK